MAGNYPDVPSWRMAYDRDGTQMFYTNATNGTLTQASNAQLQALNNEAPASGINLSGGNWMLAFIFPELRDLDGYYFSLNNPYGINAFSAQVSVNTTNGYDGTWTTYGGPYDTAPSKQKMRTAIQSATTLGIRAVRFFLTPATTGAYQSTIHLFGEPAPGENLKRLEVWHPTLNERVPPAYFDWGNVARGSTEDRQFRIKNMHGSLTARSIRVAMEALTDTTPSVPGQFTLSQGGTFAAQQNIGDLAPGATSDLLTIRRITPTNATLSLWWHRIFMETQGGWS